MLMVSVCDFSYVRKVEGGGPCSLMFDCTLYNLSQRYGFLGSPPSVLMLFQFFCLGGFCKAWT